MIYNAEDKLAYWQRRKAEEEERVLTAADQATRDVHRRMALAYAKRLAGEPVEQQVNNDQIADH